jgi:hypothetical protein
MPYKHPEKKGWKVPKQKHKVSNWSEYNEALRQRGSIEIWVSEDIIEKWYEADRVYDGTGTPRLFTDFAIITCHELRQVYRQALRQTEGLMNSIFTLMNIDLRSPDYSCLSKRLSTLGMTSPRYKKTDKPDEDVAAIAFDSSGLKRFGRDEWHQEKHKIAAKRSWRKLHIAVDDGHIIHAATLTDRFTSDDQTVDSLLEQIDDNVEHVSADGAYDKNPVYEKLTNRFPNATIVIPPSSDAVYHQGNHPQRNRNLQEIKTFGRMSWQRVREYGKRNHSELCIQRYKRILGNQLHAREMSRQKQESRPRPETQVNRL